MKVCFLLTDQSNRPRPRIGDFHQVKIGGKPLHIYKGQFWTAKNIDGFNKIARYVTGLSEYYLAPIIPMLVPDDAPRTGIAERAQLTKADFIALIESSGCDHSGHQVKIAEIRQLADGAAEAGDHMDARLFELHAQWYAQWMDEQQLQNVLSTGNTKPDVKKDEEVKKPSPAPAKKATKKAARKAAKKSAKKAAAKLLESPDTPTARATGTL